MKISLLEYNPLFMVCRIEDLVTMRLNIGIGHFLQTRYRDIETVGEILSRWTRSNHPMYTCQMDQVTYTRKDDRLRYTDTFSYDEKGRYEAFQYRGVEYRVSVMEQKDQTIYTLRCGKNTVRRLLAVQYSEEAVYIQYGGYDNLELHTNRIFRDPEMSEYISLMGSVDSMFRTEVAYKKNEQNDIRASLSIIGPENRLITLFELNGEGKVLHVSTPYDYFPTKNGTKIGYTHFNEDGYPYMARTEEGMVYEIKLSETLFRTRRNPFGELLPMKAISTADPSGQLAPIDTLWITEIQGDSKTYRHYTPWYEEIYDIHRNLNAIILREGDKVVQNDVEISKGAENNIVYRDIEERHHNELFYARRVYADGYVSKRSFVDALWGYQYDDE